MQVIFTFFEGLATTVTGLVDYVRHLIEQTVTFLHLLSDVPNFLFSYIFWLPAGVVINLSLLLTIVIFYKIIGRE